MKRAGYMIRVKDERLWKRSETKRQEGFRRRGRPQLRWEDCQKIAQGGSDDKRGEKRPATESDGRNKNER